MKEMLIILPIAIVCLIACNSRIRSLKKTTAHARPATAAAGNACLDYIAPGQGPASKRSYRFEIKRVDGEYRAYILNSPSYHNRPTDGHSTHRHYDGRYYVCWSVPVKREEDMVNIAQQWADCTQRYIESGIQF